MLSYSSYVSPVYSIGTAARIRPCRAEIRAIAPSNTKGSIVSKSIKEEKKPVPEKKQSARHPVMKREDPCESNEPTSSFGWYSNALFRVDSVYALVAIAGTINCV